MTLVDIAYDHAQYGAIAFVASLALTPVMIRVANKYGVMDMPDQKLKPHARPTPYLGGMAIGLAWVIALLASLVLGKLPVPSGVIFLAGGIGMMVLGLLDDLRDLSPKLRLGAGAAIIAAVFISTGAGFQLVRGILGIVGLHDTLPPSIQTTLSVLLAIFIVLGACNSTNLIDGLDGLCSGVTAIISLGFFLLAAHLATFKPDQEGHYIRIVMSIAMLGATLGFLPMNFNPARIFMGDAGSVLLGYNCGMLIVLFGEWGNFRWVLGALMIFALPVFDTALAMFRRWRSGKPIFKGDRSHFYDQLVQRGFTVKQAVLTCYGLTVFYGLVGLAVMTLRLRVAIPVFVAVVAGSAAIAWLSGMTHPERDPRTRSGSELGDAAITD